MGNVARRSSHRFGRRYSRAAGRWLLWRPLPGLKVMEQFLAAAVEAMVAALRKSRPLVDKCCSNSIARRKNRHARDCNGPDLRLHLAPLMRSATQKRRLVDSNTIRWG